MVYRAPPVENLSHSLTLWSPASHVGMANRKPCSLWRPRQQVIKDDVMPWLYALYLRAPDSTIILVANKCNWSIGNFSETAENVRTRVT